MKCLADTHVLVWSFFDPRRLPPVISSMLQDEKNDIYYSLASLWEISIKYSLKKLSLGKMTPEEFFQALDASFYLYLRPEPLDVITNYRLPPLHKDPFDRLLAWQAIRNNLALLSIDGRLGAYTSQGLRLIG
jgi:PIN domain nuclease of toxin-antitoxin system